MWALGERLEDWFKIIPSEFKTINRDVNTDSGESAVDALADDHLMNWEHNASTTGKMSLFCSLIFLKICLGLALFLSWWCSSLPSRLFSHSSPFLPHFPHPEISRIPPHGFLLQAPWCKGSLYRFCRPFLWRLVARPILSRTIPTRSLILEGVSGSFLSYF